jgi:hypothetical protein
MDTALGGKLAKDGQSVVKARAVGSSPSGVSTVSRSVRPPFRTESAEHYRHGCPACVSSHAYCAYELSDEGLNRAR